MSADEGGLGARVRTRRERERLERLARRRDHLRELARLGRANTYDDAEGSALSWVLDEVDRLTRERDEAREVVARMRGLADEWICCPGDSSCESQNYSDRPRAALGPRLVVGRDRAERAREVPLRASQVATSADEGPHFDDAAWIRDRLDPARSVEWTYDGPAVRPSDGNEGDEA